MPDTKSPSKNKNSWDVCGKTQARRVRFKDRMSDLYLNEPVSVLFFDSIKPPEQRVLTELLPALAAMKM